MALWRALAILAMAVGSLLAGNDTLIYLRVSDATLLDPLLTRDIYSNEVLANILEGLVRFRRDSLEVEPCLADRWDRSADGRTWTFRLREGVHFHDGRALTAAIVAAHFQRGMELGPREMEKWQTLFSRIAAVRALDERQLAITLHRPDPSLTVSLATAAGFIPAPPLPADKRRVVGTGPFQFGSWQANRNIILTRFDGYWGKPPAVAQISFRVTPDPLRRSLLLKNGNADVVQVLGAREFDEFATNRGVEMLTLPVSSTFFLAINTTHKPFDQLAVRQALACLVNKTNLVRNVFQKLAIPARSLLPPAMLPADAVFSDPPFDPDRARRLMAEAGCGGFACSLFLGQGTSDSDDIADRLIINFRRVNIRVRKVRLPMAELMSRALRGEHDLLLIGWASLIDADSFLRSMFTSEDGGYNFSHYQNPLLLELLERARRTGDLGARRELHQQAMALIARDLPLLPLAHRSKAAARRHEVHELFFNPLGYLIFREATKEPR